VKLVYAQEPFPEDFESSIFLAGPTPRSPKVKSWRPEAVSILKKRGYKGIIFIPEPRDGSFGEDFDYNEQIEWEARGLELADCILFWVPRNLKTLPGFTTNVEFGLWVRSGKVVFGAPENAPKTKYLRIYADKYGIPSSDILEQTISDALNMLKNKNPV